MARQVVVEITGNSKGFTQATEEANKAGSKFGGFMQGIAAGIGFGIWNAAVAGIQKVTSAIQASDQTFRDDQASIVLLNNALKDNVKSYDLKSIEAFVAAQAKLGFGALDVRTELDRLVGVTHNAAAAQKDLALAEDFARAHGLSLADSASIIAKASEGNVKALKQYGISIPPVTKYLDELHASHVKATPAQLAHAKAMDTAANAANALAAMQAQAKDAAAAYAKTSEGQLEIAQAKNTASWVKIGAIVDRISSVVLPLVADAFSRIADYVTANVVPAVMQLWAAGKAVVDQFMGLLAPAINYIRDHFDQLKPVLVILGVVVGVALGLIVLAVGAVIAIIVLLVVAITNVAGTTEHGIGQMRSIWNGFVSFFSGMPAKIAGVAAGMWMGIWNAFRAMLNLIIGAWNSLDFKVPSILGSPALDIRLPHIPSFALGGIVPGAGPQLVMAHGGETITPAGKYGAQEIHIHIDRGAYIDGPSIDRLANLILQRARFAPGT